MWLAVFELGFGLLLWPFVGSAGLAGAFELAGSSLGTLGYVAPHDGVPQGLDDIAALVGLGTVALQIGYLPALYAAFNRREALVTMLDSRAGVPSWGPELLGRTHYGLGTGVSAVGELPKLFDEWERWSADVSESHTTYIALIAFRSPRQLSSWLTAQLAVLDAAALYLSLIPDVRGAISARLCLRGGFTCLSAIARARGFDLPDQPDPNDGISLTYEEFVEAIERLRKVDFPLAAFEQGGMARLRGLAGQLRGGRLRPGPRHRRSAGAVVGTSSAPARTDRAGSAGDSTGGRAATAAPGMTGRGPRSSGQSSPERARAMSSARSGLWKVPGARKAAIT